jgi:hypothetical protein
MKTLYEYTQYAAAFGPAAILIGSLPKVSGLEITKCNGSKVILRKADIENVLKNWK